MPILGISGASKEAAGGSSSKSGPAAMGEGGAGAPRAPGGGGGSDSNVGDGGNMLKLTMDLSEVSGAGLGGLGNGARVSGSATEGGASEGSGTLGSGGGLLKLSMDEDGLREMRDNMAAAAKIVKQHHAGAVDGGLPQVRVISVAR